MTRDECDCGPITDDGIGVPGAGCLDRDELHAWKASARLEAHHNEARWQEVLRLRTALRELLCCIDEHSDAPDGASCWCSQCTARYFAKEALR